MPNTSHLSRLEELAIDGVLPFLAVVELRVDGQWVAEASGSSVRWLLGAADDAADFGRVRIVSQWGEVLAS